MDSEWGEVPPQGVGNGYWTVETAGTPHKSQGKRGEGWSAKSARPGKDENRSSGLAGVNQGDLRKSHVSKWW